AMPRKKLSVAVVVAATLVTVITLLLGAFGLARYMADRDEKRARLKAVNTVEADVLATSLALPIWNIDRPQIDKILQSMEDSPSIYAIVVDAAGQRQARLRQGSWLQPVYGTFSTTGMLREERPIVLNNQRIGTVRLYATPRYIEAELHQSLVRMLSG